MMHIKDEKVKVNGNSIKEIDYCRDGGFHVNLLHYEKVKRIRQEKNLSELKDFKIHYDKNNKHPLLDCSLRDNLTGEVLKIVSYTRYHFYGYYWVVVCEDVNGRKSQFMWENQSCYHHIIKECIEKVKNKFTAINK